ncbi:flagellar hook-associated protein FlgL [Brenneria tiliae]|uniref:flagellar hook-associated protein FlgL n=1 Tax=Brenneria tiliae TaxID=2914984 RepID=UPI0020148E3E|nr:flagellar hook-associated protein FlgL [Brenneria tiliae]MCL2899826.1 flagellar hook-associated protein FlgL [Brenneria tiliae]MCL2904685.1 flagellar hook-associated protein FlgL [Brenneria tiliae]
MRLSTSVIYQQQLSSMMKLSSDLATAAEQTSSGIRVSKPSDDPVAAAQAVLLSQTQASSEQYSTARSNAENSLAVEDSTLDEVVNVIQSIQTLLVKAGNTTYSDVDRESMATELQTYKDQLVALGNSTDGSGNYIFGGYATGSEPFSVADDGTVTYNGSSSAISLSVSGSLNITIGDTGTSIFGDNGSNIFDIIDSVLTSLGTSLEDADSGMTQEEYSASINAAIGTMSEQLDDVLTAQTALGGKLTAIDSLNSLNSTLDIVYSGRMTDLVEIDFAEATATYSMLQVALQASAYVTSSMMSMSLFEMNS